MSVFLEANLVTREQQILVCQLAVESGVKFVSVVTGNVETIRFVRETVGEKFGIKKAVAQPSKFNKVSNQFGVDLNRNYAFKWGTVNGPSTDATMHWMPGRSSGRGMHSSPTPTPLF